MRSWTNSTWLHQSSGQKFRASLEIQDNAIVGGKIKLYSGIHKKKIEAELEVAKIAIEHLKNFLDFEVEDLNYQDKEFYRFHLEHADFALANALQENKDLDDHIAKIIAKAQVQKIMN